MGGTIGFSAAFFFPSFLPDEDVVFAPADELESAVRRLGTERRVGVGVDVVLAAAESGDETAFTITCTGSVFAGAAGAGA